MCRYSYARYKSHFACFNCRKTFKQPPFTDLLEKISKDAYYQKLRSKPLKTLTANQQALLADVEKNYKNRKVKCPECSNYMADLGLDFKSPKKSAIKEWKVIEGLYTTGHCFYSCGCYGIGYIPQNPAAYEHYLTDVLQSYERSMANYQKKSTEECTDKAERLEYWSERLVVIKTELKRVGIGKK